MQPQPKPELAECRPQKKITRRRDLLAALGAGVLACRSRTMTSKSSAPAAPPSSNGAQEALDWGGLDVTMLGDMRPDERGGAAVVLLHGWRARGDDLVSLARRLSRPKVRFFLPAAPLADSQGGRAWWHLADADRPAHVWDDALPSDFRPHPQVLRVRSAVQTVLKTIRARYVPERLMLAGFSQGAMVTLDVALAADPPVDRAASLSGVLIADSLEALRAARGPRPRFLVAHGRNDTRLDFRGSVGLNEMLSRYGFSVTFHPFDGGHEIPPEVVGALETFLFAEP